MAHAQEKFDEYFGKMALYNTIAADNSVLLKQVLLKGPDMNEVEDCG
jgi:hypothetical protein